VGKLSLPCLIFFIFYSNTFNQFTASKEGNWMFFRFEQQQERERESKNVIVY
jgi:hypothetical protein